MFVDHKNAKATFNKIVLENIPNWIVVSGGEQSGKTSFIKEVCRSDKTLFCEPQFSLFYLNGFINKLDKSFRSITRDFLCQNSYKFQKTKEHNNFSFDYINDIQEYMYSSIIDSLIKIDMEDKKFEYANYLGNNLREHIDYIVLEDFYKCDILSYDWLISFADAFLKEYKYIIAVCDFEKQWISPHIQDTFHEIPVLIDIKTFDTSQDFFDVLKEKVYFENVQCLKQVSNDLFELYQGNAQLLFKTINIYQSIPKENDYNRQKHLLQIANNITCNMLEEFNSVDKLIIGLLAISPVKLSMRELSMILDISTDLIEKVILKQYNNHLLVFETSINSSAVYYVICDSLISKMIMHNIDIRTKEFLLTRLYNLGKTGDLSISNISKIELAFEINSSETEELLINYLEDETIEISTEIRLDYINRLYLLDLHHEHLFSNYENAKKAYDYGYLQTAYKMLQYLATETQEHNYNLLMLLGGVQHLLLLPEAPKTFEKAAGLSCISTSQKLSALNRQIMSLNQADQTSADSARKLYDFILETYKDEKCDGMVEIYRNTNNSYSFDKALAYTIKGYNLALELSNELEKYKCLHNICMIQLHQNNYSISLPNLNTNIKSAFELVDDYFAKNPEHYHRRAYPLLDLGTYEMFQYIMTDNGEHLREAKVYFSKAQLFAKSFYARHIAEISLLLTNSHLYCGDKHMINSITQNRTKLYEKYQSQSIVDCRVNRKILLSLAASSLLTHNLCEAKMYLDAVKKYMCDSEKPRFTNLCLLCNGNNVDLQSLKTKERLYYEYPYFVPWLISLAH